MKSVCIVGAGPAGLVAAKTFIQSGQFSVTIYEKSHRIGGIWALDEGSQTGYLDPQTPTNLSRFTVGFSDLDWNSVDLRRQHADLMQSTRDAAPMFPKAWQVNRYLESYREKYIPNEHLKLGHEVVRTERLGGSPKQWKVTTRDERQKTEMHTFDFLLIGSGFFSASRPPKSDMFDLDGSHVKAMHSSQFRSLGDLLDTNPSTGNILIIGGGNSSGETAAAVAMQLSNARWSPRKSTQSRYEGYKVIHVTPRPLYPLPPYNEYEPGSAIYTPLDLKLYDLSKRAPGMPSYGGQQSPETKDMIHRAIQAMAGGDQSDLSDALVNCPGESRHPAYVALNESYWGFVQNGLIDVVAGRVTNVKSGLEDKAVALVMNTDGEIKLENIASVIYATGYTPMAALDFLPEDVKQALNFDPTSMRLPLILEQWQTSNDAIPEIAFLGFYEGPYWPMMEMQARLVAQRWQHGSIAPEKPYESHEKLFHIRQAMQDRARDVPQYWFQDYAGYLADIADHLSLTRNDGSFTEREGCASPARYVSPNDDRSQADAIMRDLHKTWNDCMQHGKYVPRAAFRAMQGDWNITRRIVSTDENFSGTLTGTASFHPRFPTHNTTKEYFDLEYLYVETGVFRSARGLEMRASRRYVYRYTETGDRLSVWFVKPDKDLEVDYLFHNLDFTRGGKGNMWLAKADHLCVKDMYQTEYELPFKAITLPSFKIQHTVRGPSKDYVATTQYVRPERKASGVAE